MAIILLFFLGWIIAILLVISFFETKEWGFYKQERIGRDGKVFKILKIRTMLIYPDDYGHITTANDPRITYFGRKMRRYKLDELPQLLNILLGDMSFVGPRPDLKGYADNLKGEDKIILSIKPGITSPATLKYKSEEVILAKQIDPKKYNDEVIWPDKVRLNKEYALNWTFKKDLLILYKTIFK